ncbi:dodecin domain-containing protein [Mycobacterium alsense]|uniref:dodecin domain-containing protein n=1 Tax=Mycobacterium alsense TaxID=324058 RepID=UPI000AABF466
MVEIVGTPPDGTDAAIRRRQARAARTMLGLDWSELVSIGAALAAEPSCTSR